MNKTERFIQFLKVLNDGSAVKIGNHEYALSVDDKLCICTYDRNGNRQDDVMTIDFSYNQMLDVIMSGLKEIHNEDMFTFDWAFDDNKIPAFCITTNGIVKADGHAVMGKGNAKQINDMFHVSEKLGKMINQYGNRVFNLGTYDLHGYKLRLISFPTKHDWKDNSDLTLISKSCTQLVELCDKFNIDTCFLPAPGVSNGNLSYHLVKPVLELTLDERFYICFK